MFATVGRFVAPPGMPSPVLWGDEAVVRERFSADVSGLSLDRVNYRLDYPFSPAEVVEFFRLYYGPTTKAFEALDEDGRQMLRADLTELWSSHNLSKDPARTVVDAEYLHVAAVRA